MSAKPRLSIVLIVKNEEARLGRLLSDLRPLAAEIVVVDTGSTDRTREIAEKAGAGVFNEPWTQDFAAARNKSLERATGNWILWLDADDRLLKEDGEAILKLIAGAPPRCAFTVEVINSSKDGRPSSFLQLRLFPRDPSLRFEGRVHESVAGAAKRAGYDLRNSGVRVIHTGYETREERESKVLRNLAILEEELRRDPGNTAHRFLYANTLAFMGRLPEALVQYEKAVTTPGGEALQGDVHVRSLVALARGHGDAGRLGPAEDWGRKAVAARPDDMEARYELGRILLHRGRVGEAQAEINAALACEPYVSSVFVDFIAVRAACYDVAARILHLSQKHIEAAALIRKGLEELPLSSEMARIAASFFVLIERLDEAEAVYRQAKLRFPAAAGEFEAPLKGLKILKERGRESGRIHPDYLAMLPAGTASVLVAGAGTGLIALELKKAGVARVSGLLLPGDEPETASARFDRLYAGQDALRKSGEAFDAVLLGDQLCRHPHPADLTATLRAHLREGAAAVFAFPNVRNYSLLASLGYGFWNYGDTGVLRSGHVRHFTRSTAAAFLDQHGFRTVRIHAVVDPLFTEQVMRAPAKAVNLGKAILDLEGLSEAEMQEFFTVDYFFACEKRILASEVARESGLPARVSDAKVRELCDAAARLIAEGRYDEAARRAHEALARDPRSAEALSCLGLTEWYAGRFEDAWFLFKQAVHENPVDTDLLLNLWDASQKTGRQKEAILLLQAALEKNPGLPEIREILKSAGPGPA